MAQFVVESLFHIKKRFDESPLLAILLACVQKWFCA